VKKNVDSIVQYFKQLHREKRELELLYSPVVGQLRKRGGETGWFDFAVQVSFNLERMVAAGDALINHNVAGRFYKKTAEALRDAISEVKPPKLSLEGDDLSRQEAQQIEEFIGRLQSVFSEYPATSVSVTPLLKSDYSERDFFAWLYDATYYSVSFSLKFRGTELDALSPGLKGAALLILYLELDTDDRPLLVDQPEENLDNRTVYELLREYFRRAKSRRQIIIVTHNPNLVVNTDAEQVIVADFDGACARQPAHICYRMGSLENRFLNPNAPMPLEQKGIRDHICHVLEGGEEAFRKRERKYGFSHE
jgi:hypothetical protein